MSDVVVLTQTGGFKKANKFLEKCLEKFKLGYLDKYGKLGVEALEAATPKDSGLAASSWSYEIVREPHLVRLQWHNDDVEHGFNVAILIQYGHATKSGTWVEGRDFINPALEPIYEQIKQEIRNEVSKH